MHKEILSPEQIKLLPLIKNYDEAVNFLPGFEVNDDVVKQKLVEFSLMDDKK